MPRDVVVMVVEEDSQSDTVQVEEVQAEDSLHIVGPYQHIDQEEVLVDHTKDAAQEESVVHCTCICLKLEEVQAPVHEPLQE